MAELETDFRLRAVITEIGPDYLISVTKILSDNTLEIMDEKEVDSIEAAHGFIAQIASDSSYPSDAVEKLYNIAGKITKKPPKGRK